MIKFALYLITFQDGEVLFHDKLFSSFNTAKKKMDIFLEEFSKKRGKKTIEISKDDLEKLKSKKPEDHFYIRKKKSEIIIYSRIILTGRIYNSYSIEKFGKIGINEFLIQNNEIKNKTNEIHDETNETNYETNEINDEINDEKEYEISNLHITNHERGNHVLLISELKNVLNKRKDKNLSEIKIEKRNLDNSFNDSLKESLIEGKKLLKNINQPN